MNELTHLRDDGSAHMVDVSGKVATDRRAVAQAVLTTRPDVVSAVISGALPKGEAIGTARIAGILAAKQTSTLIPLCHPLPLTSISIDITGAESSLLVVASVATTSQTGVEMEALTAAAVSALTLYDMIKALDKLAVISEIKVVEKSGGKSGDWTSEMRRSAVVLVTSSRAAAGVYDDRTGPVIADWLTERGFTVAPVVVVADGPGVPLALRTAIGANPQLLVTTGGTGVGAGDGTSDATAALLEKPMPGFSEELRRRGAASTPFALVSRGVAGVVGGTFVVNLPGSTGGVRDGLQLLDEILDHVLDQLDGGNHV